MIACERGNSECVKLLLKNNALKDIQDNKVYSTIDLSILKLYFAIYY